MAQQIQQTAPVVGLKAFNDLIGNERTKKYLTKVMGDKAQSFISNMTAIVANSELLQGCTPTSLMYAGIKATALGLPLDPALGCAYVLPYNNFSKHVTEAQFQMGYKGFIQLAQRTGMFKTINATDVREGEIVEFDLLSGCLTLKAAENRESLPIVGYAAYFRLLNGFEKTLYMTDAEMEQHALRYSQSYGSAKQYIKDKSPWTTNRSEMAKKTVLKLLISKYAPMSVELQTATEIDQSVITADSVEYVDNGNSKALNEAAMDANLLKFALEDINNAPDMETLDEIEQNQKMFWGNETFKSALAEKKKTLTQ